MELPVFIKLLFCSTIAFHLSSSIPFQTNYISELFLIDPYHSLAAKRILEVFKPDGMPLLKKDNEKKLQSNYTRGVLYKKSSER